MRLAYGLLGIQLGNQLGIQLGNQLGNQLSIQLSNQPANQFVGTSCDDRGPFEPALGYRPGRLHTELPWGLVFDREQDRIDFQRVWSHAEALTQGPHGFSERLQAAWGSERPAGARF